MADASPLHLLCSPHAALTPTEEKSGASASEEPISSVTSSPRPLLSKSISIVFQSLLTTTDTPSTFAYFGEVVNPLSRSVRSELLHSIFNHAQSDSRELVAGSREGLDDLEGRRGAWYEQGLRICLDSQLSGSPLRNFCRVMTEYHQGTPRKGACADLYRCFKEGGRLMEEIMTKNFDVTPLR